jgi:hypothetical protein
MTVITAKDSPSKGAAAKEPDPLMRRSPLASASADAKPSKVRGNACLV